MKKALDELDRRLVGLLTNDGRMPVGDIANCLGVSAPNVRNRITSIDIPQVGNVVKSETFVVMKSNSKWISLPSGVTGDQQENR